MFPTSGLFKSRLCPDYTTCRLNPCLYSHMPTSAIPGVRQAQTTASTIPQKRAAGAGLADAGPSKTPHNAHSAKPTPQVAKSKVLAPTASGSGSNLRHPAASSSSSSAAIDTDVDVSLPLSLIYS